MASVIQYVESISGALEGQPSKLGYEVRKARKGAAAIAPGRFVCRSSTDYDCKVPTTVAEVLACIGATVLSDTIPLNDDGNYASGKRIPIFSKAPGLWMVTIDAATEGGQVYVNYAGANPAGSVSAAFVSGENVALPGARFGSTQATPGGLAEVMFSCPVSAPSFGGAIQRHIVAVVTITAGVPTVAASSGLTVTDTGTGIFKLTVAGAASVLPAGQPILERATDSTVDALPMICEVAVLAATEITYGVLVQQAADQLFDIADLTTLSKVYVPLLVTYA
jgi:hypothetical protein